MQQFVGCITGYYSENLVTHKEVVLSNKRSLMKGFMGAEMSLSDFRLGKWDFIQRRRVEEVRFTIRNKVIIKIYEWD